MPQLNRRKKVASGELNGRKEAAQEGKLCLLFPILEFQDSLDQPSHTRKKPLLVLLHPYLRRVP